MTILGWDTKYREILKQFGYKRKDDSKSAQLLNSILKKPIPIKVLEGKIKGRPVFCIGSGYSLAKSFETLRRNKKIIKIAADTAVKPLLENKIIPDIIVTDLDGDEESLKKLGKTNVIFVVHAHGDNMTKLHFAENFKNCIGTTQTKPIGKIINFGGFTDGDRTVFLADYFDAKKIILFGMDFGSRISAFSKTKKSERSTKIKKLKKGRELLEWLAGKTSSELYTTSNYLQGFKKIANARVDSIIT